MTPGFGPQTIEAAFLFTDIQGSTALWERHPEAMADALQRHDEILRACIEQNGGTVFKTIGDAFCAVFATAREASAATLAIQSALAAESWGETGPLLVRTAVHFGTAEARDGDYFGTTLNRAARVLSAGHGGQVLFSETAAALLRDTLPPDHALRDLGPYRLKGLTAPERIFQYLCPDLPATFPPLNTLDLRPNNLPAALTTFVGRKKEVAEIVGLLRRPDIRLVTLTGPGGTGKTRLALEVGYEYLSDASDGAFFVQLGSIGDPSLVASAVATALNVEEEPGAPVETTLAKHLATRQVLLILDNFEHLMDAAGVASTLLAAAPRLKILVSSREWLNVYGEYEYRVAPLALPPAERADPADLRKYESVLLFEERGQASRPGFAIDAENAGAIADICRSLDGLPLAIELAAAQLRRITPKEIRDRLKRRLALLTQGPRDLPTRQQTLRATISWSYNLLTEDEGRLFRRLAIFAGGCTREAAEAVCGRDEADVGLDALVDKSLLRELEEGDSLRYAMLQTVREYALEELQNCGEAEDIRAKYVAYLLDLATRLEPALRSREQMRALETLERDHDNFRAAIDMAGESAEHEAEGVVMAAALSRFWALRSHLAEGRARMEQAAARRESVPPVNRVWALLGAWNLAYFHGDTSSLRDYAAEGLKCARESGDGRAIGHALLHTALTALDFDPAKSAVDGEEGRAIAVSIGDAWLEANMLLTLGYAAMIQGDIEGALARFDEGRARAKSTGDRWLTGMLLVNLGRLHTQVGRHAESGGFHREQLGLSLELGDRRGIAWSLIHLAAVAGDLGEVERAARLLGAKAALLQALGCTPPPELQADAERTLALARSELGDERFQKLEAEGRSWSQQEAVAYALAADS